MKIVPGAVQCVEDTCKAEFIFLDNPASGNRVPVDVDSLSEDEVAEIALTKRTDGITYDPERHVSHFKTCTKPGRFTRRKTDRA